MRWRRKRKKATLTEIEDTVDAEIAKMRGQVIQDVAMASETAKFRLLPKKETEMS